MVRHAEHGHLTDVHVGRRLRGHPRDPARGPRLLDLRAEHPRAPRRSPSMLDRRDGASSSGASGGARSGSRPPGYAAALVLGLAGLDDVRARARVGLLRERRVLLGPDPAARPAAEGGRRRPSGSACSGSSAGVAFYETFQIVADRGQPRLVWLAWRQRRVLRYAWARRCPRGRSARFPSLVWNVRHDWASLHLDPGADFSYASRVSALPLAGASGGRSACGSATRMRLDRPDRRRGGRCTPALIALFAYGAYRSRQARRDGGVPHDRRGSRSSPQRRRRRTP